MELMLGRIVGRRISVILQPGNDLNPIFADPGQIEQLVLHLATSAREHMPEGGRLVLETCNFEMDESFIASHPGSRVGVYVCLNVRDTGEGMDTETRTHLFDPVLTVSEPGKCARLGLASVFGIVKQYGGYIWVNSEPGFGTCISVYLPRADVQRVPEPITPVIATDDDTPTVLVVELLDSLRQFTCEFLRMAHYRVLEAASGEQAIEMAGQQGHIDLVVCGVILPGMSGLELAECVTSYHPGIQVLYIAGDAGDASLCPEWLQNSAQFVTAPFDPREFSNKVAALIGKAHNYNREKPPVEAAME
jgi:CheY-like chemotaxis protein